MSDKNKSELRRSLSSLK